MKTYTVEFWGFDLARVEIDPVSAAEPIREMVARESFARENFAGPYQGEQRRAAAAGLLAAAVALKQRCELFVRDTLHPEE